MEKQKLFAGGFFTMFRPIHAQSPTPVLMVQNYVNQAIKQSSTVMCTAVMDQASNSELD